MPTQNKQAIQWVMVPREPTDAMMQAGLYQSSHDSTWADVYSMWKEMIAAVPDREEDA